MIEFLLEYGMFLAKLLTVLVAVLIVISAIGALAGRQRHQDDDGYLRVKHLNEETDELRDGLRLETMSEGARKADIKRQRKEEKQKRKAEKKAPLPEKSRPNVYVLDFDGDVQASAVVNLRREISAVLQVASKEDEIVIRLESPGGLVHSYGLAASQLRRIGNQGIQLTVCVDEVAASGGYMMACIGDRILAAPFAVLGSVGVVAQLPNFNRLLRKNDIDVELHTAGEYKRTLTVFGENTDEDRLKFREELEDTHILFKQFVQENRRQLDVDKIATGEHWYGVRALELGLVDEILTSDEYLLKRMKSANVYEISWQHKKRLAERLGMAAQLSFDRVLNRLMQLAFKRWQ